MGKLMHIFLLSLVLLAIAVYLRLLSVDYVLRMAEALMHKAISLWAGAR